MSRNIISPWIVGQNVKLVIKHINNKFQDWKIFQELLFNNKVSNNFCNFEKLSETIKEAIKVHVT